MEIDQVPVSLEEVRTDSGGKSTCAGRRRDRVREWNQLVVMILNTKAWTRFVRRYSVSLLSTVAVWAVVKTFTGYTILPVW